MKNPDRLEELLLTAKLRTCSGTVFWFCYRSDRERIALFLARLEEWKTVEERTVLVCPEEPMEPWVEKLTDISDLDLEQTMPLEDTLIELERIWGWGRCLVLDQGFILPFLESTYDRCGKKFSLCFLTLDCLLEQLGTSPRRRIGKFLVALPPSPESGPDVPPENMCPAQQYRLTRALLCRLEETE